MVTATADAPGSRSLLALLTTCSMLSWGRQLQLPSLKGFSHPETQQSLGVIAAEAKI